MRRGFTLIELLVVIAIIAILAGLLFPVFARAKAAAGDARSISNAKQLGDAFTLYLGDSDDVFPLAADGTPGTNRVGWTVYTTFGNEVAGTFDVAQGSVYPYVTAKAVFQTSGDPDAPKSGDSFAFNGALGDWTGTGLNSGHAFGSVQFSANQMMLAEEGSGAGGIFGYGRGTNDGYFNPDFDHFAPFHPGGTVVLCADTHAKIIHAEDRYLRTVCGVETVCWK